MPRKTINLKKALMVPGAILIANMIYFVSGRQDLIVLNWLILSQSFFGEGGRGNN